MMMQGKDASKFHALWELGLESSQPHVPATLPSEQLLDRRLGGYDGQEKNRHTFMESNPLHLANFCHFSEGAVNKTERE
jgi:hypothetical protein